jgi:hypothetical protein
LLVGHVVTRSPSYTLASTSKCTHTWANNGQNVKRARGPLEAFPFSDAENVQVGAKWCQVIRITKKFEFPAFWNAFKRNAQFQHFIQILGWDCSDSWK